MSDQKPSQENKVWRAIKGYYEEAKTAKWERMLQNRDNWDCYHLIQDWSHKQKGQSKEFLPKQAQAVEQITSFLQLGLMDIGSWFRVEREPGVKDSEVIFKPIEIQNLLGRQLDKNDFINFIADQVKRGQLESLMIAKVGGMIRQKVKYQAVEKKGLLSSLNPFRKKGLEKEIKEVWQLKLHQIRAEDWFPDPTGSGLYEIEAIEMDYHELVKLARENPDEFDLETVEKMMNNSNRDYMQEQKKTRETHQNSTVGTSVRKRVRIIELWGNICDPDTGELLHENVVARITLDGHTITKPKKNPLWYEGSPFVVSPILRVPQSVWHKALADAGTYLNRALNEAFNLQFDSGLMSVFGIKQLREDWLDNVDEISDGISPGMTLKANNSCPPGMKVLERVDTGALTEESLEMYNIADREFQSSMFTSDIRMGNLPQRSVKATEIVASNQAIQGVFSGIVKRLEQCFIAEVLYKSWVTSAQHMDDLDSDEVMAILGEERAQFLASMSPEERFAKTAQGHKFKVFGLSQTLNKIQEFKKLQTLLQTIGTSEILLKEFMRKYSIAAFMGEIIKSLDIDDSKLAITPEEQQQRAQEQQQQMQMAMAMAQLKAGGGAGGGKRTLEQGANVQSQIPQTSAEAEGADDSPGNPANEMGLTA